VNHFDTAQAQHICDQRSMAAPPDRFRAHDRGAVARGQEEQFVQPFGELGTR
jgi:hypothetical protein